MYWFKYVALSILFIGVLIFIYNSALNQQATLTSTQEIEFLDSSINVGASREGEISISIDQAVSELLLEIAETKKGKHHETKVSYVFLDENDNPTIVDTDARSIQFEVVHLNDKGQETTKSTERIEINELIN